MYVYNMKPRQLRHRLEKSAKLLVVVQKYFAEATCSFAYEAGNDGSLIVRLPLGTDPKKLGADLESKGFVFKRKHNPWLGLLTYRGDKSEQPSVLIEIETAADRLNQSQEISAEAYSFKG